MDSLGLFYLNNKQFIDYKIFSLENNGGFASFNGWVGRRLTNYRGIRVSARTDTPGRDFQMYLQPATGDKTAAFWYNKVALTNQFQ